MPTITKESIKIDIQLATDVEEQGHTIVHCKSQSEGWIRIWPSTYLIDNMHRRYKLLYPIDINLFPNWGNPVNFNNGFAYFTLIFEALHKTATSFYMLEDIPEPGGFYSGNYSRNKTDIYNIEVFSD